MTQLDLDLVRAQFPAYDDGNPLGELAFFEAAGGSFPCRQVVASLTEFYTASKVQPGHPYQPSTTAAARMDETHRRLADWVGVEPDEVHIGPSTTQHAYVLAGAFGEVLGPGDAVVVTDQAHEANAGPWDRLADVGVDVRVWHVDPATGSLHLDGLRTVLDADVAVVAFPHVSNLLGESNDVAAISTAIHRVGALAVVDGVAAAPHGLPWMDDIGADVYLFSSYKTFGPHQGVALVRRAVLDQLPNQGHYFNADQPRKRLVPAGPDHAQVVALAAVVDYLEVLDDHFPTPAGDPATRNRRVQRLVRDAEIERLTPLMAMLADRDDVRILGPSDPTLRVPTVAVALDRDAAEVATALGTRGVACGAGHFYSQRLVQAMGVDPSAVLRLSFTHTTAAWEVERAVAELTALLDGGPAAAPAGTTPA